ncbi:hypothetical protein DFH09DRAFT_1272277 [Mycena vulgaris]|nr:hypothetical protein DFH09DRAFT_1272277 [Mycena vulgaris]
MNDIVGQQNSEHDVLGAGPADSDPPATADTLPSFSPPPATGNDDENPPVAPSSKISPETIEVTHDDKDPPTVHTSDLHADDMLPETADPNMVSATAEMKRVQVYKLVGQRWIDQGIAFCFGQFQEDSKQVHLIARSERNYSNTILSTPIQSTDVYRRHAAETVIRWTEPNGADYALSFEDPEGCSEVWNFILDVQQHLNVSEHVSSSQTTRASKEGTEPDEIPHLP